MIVGFFIIAGVIARLLPHPPNFTPIAAIALFGGVYLDKRLALVVPIGVMLISDFFIGFHELMPYVYGSFLLTSFLGLMVRRNKRPWLIMGTSLASSVLFYLLTNFGVWLETSLYPKTYAGLLQSYFMALPFFRNTVLGNLFYTTVFFGGYKFVKLKMQSEKLKVLLNF